MAYDFRTVPVNDIRVNENALRGVDTENEQYLALVRDVARRGILKPILVREQSNDEGDFFELCDGLQRFSAAVENGFSEVPISVQSLTDAEVEETQIVANLIKVDMKAIDYTKQLLKMLQRNPTMTTGELAEMISASAAFVDGRLGLLKLTAEIQEIVNNGDIPLTNAIELSKMPKDEQTHWVESAMTQKPSEFVPAAKARVKEIKDAARLGRKAEGVKFTATAKMRKLSEVQREHETSAIGLQLIQGTTDPLEAYKLGLAYAMSTDPISVDQQRQKWEDSVKKREVEKATKAAEREEKRRTEAEAKEKEARALVDELMGA